MERVLAIVSFTLFVIWLFVDIIYWGVPGVDLYRDGLFPHRRMFDMIGLALLICAGAGGLIWLVRATIARMRRRT